MVTITCVDFVCLFTGAYVVCAPLSLYLWQHWYREDPYAADYDRYFKSEPCFCVSPPCHAMPFTLYVCSCCVRLSTARSATAVDCSMKPFSTGSQVTHIHTHILVHVHCNTVIFFQSTYCISHVPPPLRITLVYYFTLYTDMSFPSLPTLLPSCPQAGN